MCHLERPKWLSDEGEHQCTAGDRHLTGYKFASWGERLDTLYLRRGLVPAGEDGELALEYVADLLTKYKVFPTHLGLQNNGLTCIPRALLERPCFSCLRQLDLSENLLSGDIGSELLDALPQLKAFIFENILILSGNGIFYLFWRGDFEIFLKSLQKAQSIQTLNQKW